MGNPTQRQKTGGAQIWVKEALLFQQKYKVEMDLLTDTHTELPAIQKAVKCCEAQSGTSSVKETEQSLASSDCFRCTMTTKRTWKLVFEACIKGQISVPSRTINSERELSVNMIDDTTL